MDHKDKAKKYFEEEYLKNHSYFGKEGKDKIDSMFYHLFEAFKKELINDLILSQEVKKLKLAVHF